MGEAYLNGRVPLAWEVAAVERGRACERDRDEALLAGVLAGERDREPQAWELPRQNPDLGRRRPVADISAGFS